MSWLQRLRIDKFLLVLILVVIVASLFPCEGIWKTFFEHLTTAAIALLFFMHGAKLSREAIIAAPPSAAASRGCAPPLHPAPARRRRLSPPELP